MRIAFLTGCLESGKDGVGDYTRDLAAACAQAGHVVMLIALNDRYVTGAHHEELQLARGIAVDTLRLPAAESWPVRTSTALAWLGARRPDWVSLQFVPYAFHRKGMVTGLDRHLAPLVGGCRVHLMFHEIWIGVERGASLRRRLVGRLQRFGVLRLVRSLAPTVMHTTNPAYIALLAATAVPTRLLPLCGSVPIAPIDPEWLPHELVRLGVPLDSTVPRTGCWWFGMFGSLYPIWSAEPLFTRIAVAAEKAQRRVVIASIGHQRGGAQLWRALESRYAGRFSLCALGERSAAEISWFLQSVDFGIATTPWQLIGKSATAAAMVDHGLPVIVSRDDIAFDVAATPLAEPLLHRMDEHLARWLIEAPPRGAPRDRLADLATRFLSDLSAAGAQ